MNNVCQVSTQPSAATTALAVATFCHRRRRRHFSPLSFRQRCALRLRFDRSFVVSPAPSLALPAFVNGKSSARPRLEGREERGGETAGRTKGEDRRAAPGRPRSGMPLALAPGLVCTLREICTRPPSNGRRLKLRRSGREGGPWRREHWLLKALLARPLPRWSFACLLACLLTYMALTEHKSRRPFGPGLPSFGGLMRSSVAKHVKWRRR